MVFFSDVYAESLLRQRERGAETKALVGLGNCPFGDCLGDIDWQNPEGSMIDWSSPMETGGSVPGMGVVLPELLFPNTTTTPAPGTPRTQAPAGAPGGARAPVPFYKQPWFIPTAAGAALLVGFLLLGGKK